MAPFSEHVDTFRPTVLEIDEIFFGGPLGPLNPRNNLKKLF